MINCSQLIEDMDLEGNPSDHRIVVAMSGGVDSSVTAALLVKAGFNVVGLTMQLYDHGKALQKKGACCAGSDINDARSVANKLGIAHYVLNYENLFQDQVMEDFADSYLKGETPIPCIRCNQTVKFTDMFDRAKKLGASAMATGHYIRRKRKFGKPALYKGIDNFKDQSYFLFATTNEQLEFLRFPLGSLTKDETRNVAKLYELNVAEKPDSQDICFVPEGKYADIVRKLRPGSIDKGDIVDIKGNILGQHNGIIDYTIGQRKGIGIGGRKGVEDKDTILYVIELDPYKNQVIVGPKEYLKCKEIVINECNWITENPQKMKSKVWVKLRNSSDPVSGKINVDLETGSSALLFDEPQYGVSTGQAAVVYNPEDTEHVLGGGWITKAPNMLS
ncbi:tRNA 2-thiouridine(34) synthase MnmA [Alphaproteobacteria bacterium]|jgi:tRNA-specific 2-thiouridylase|nr:tRNA 2-thiouridine(34) synthase MnmA [Alphaproteobacteria bacterium]MDA9164576.1 tRNA 2-thiouridine(34) synthase MnmA [Alphaproteobacteria bacterium]MDB2584347.1 tRNA 2-thiouridine(34) synthase MnmA [Alphaproteobacteria bacterium]